MMAKLDNSLKRAINLIMAQKTDKISVREIYGELKKYYKEEDLPSESTIDKWLRKSGKQQIYNLRTSRRKLQSCYNCSRSNICYLFNFVQTDSCIEKFIDLEKFATICDYFKKEK